MAAGTCSTPGSPRARGGAVQRIGLATSDDLLAWKKQELLLEADPRWYETLGANSRAEAWRDPWVVWDDHSRRFHLLISARANHGPADGRG
jgi:beta-fructofuranosidase